jgi:CO/xanthine dehydrogenase Mo-binding subunit
MGIGLVPQGRDIFPSLGVYENLVMAARGGDMPEIEVILLEEPAPSDPFGAKGVGEPGMTNMAQAITNVLCDAISVKINSLPITPRKGP